MEIQKGLSMCSSAAIRYARCIMIPRSNLSILNERQDLQASPFYILLE